MPWELKLVRVRLEPWTIEDSLLLSRMSGFLTLAQSQGEVERLFVEMVQAGIDDANLEALRRCFQEARKASTVRS